MIHAVASHPRIFPWITDDSSVSAKLWEPPMSDQTIWLLASKVELGALGWGGFFPKNGVTLETHFAFLPKAWGARAVEAFMLMILWIRMHTSYLRLVGEIPSSNRLAVKFAKRAGFRCFGINQQSIRRKGRLEDQLCFGLNLVR